MADKIVELQIQVFEDLDRLCSSLVSEEWALPTDCPGWDVKDNLSHIVGTEAMLLGRPAPEHDPGDRPWIRNPVGAGNEIQVDYRRNRSGLQVLDEFREVTAERAEKLRALTDEDLAADSWTPIGPGTVRDLLAVRTMDCWVHEQDIRRAVGKPGGLDTEVAAHVFSRHASALGFVVAKKAGAPEGTVVVFDVAGQGRVAVGVEGKRGRVLDQVPDDPDVVLSTDFDTFNRLCCGRGDAEVLAKAVRIGGDEALGRAIVANHNFMV